jgi:hypothetical protein
MMRFRDSIAAERIPYGSPVKVNGTECRVCTSLAEMDGVASRYGRGDDAYQPGEVVKIKTDGGIRIALAVDGDVVFKGILTRLLASEPNYITLQNGKIIA